MSQPWDEFDSDEEEQVRECGEGCGHYDSLNQCCWVASRRGLCTDVSEGDLCRYGFKEDDGK